MEKPNSTSDLQKYLQNGKLTKPFLQTEYVMQKVMCDYNAKVADGRPASKLSSLFRWIDKYVEFEKQDKDFVVNNKFMRNAEQIWLSKKTTGCTDYAILFACFARQIGIPTTFLHTAEQNYINRLKNGEITNRHVGHSFCECFYDGEWVLVDPTYKKIEYCYNAEKIVLSYNVGENNVFVPYMRDLDLGEKQSIRQHNDIMDKMMSEQMLHIDKT